jgi:ferredoxin-type protein NapH
MTRLAPETRSAVLARPAWLALSYAFTALAWSLAAFAWSRGEPALAACAFAAGLSLGPCLAGYLSAPLRYKQLLRRIVLFTGGLSILAPLAGATSLELESFFVLLFAGTMGAAVGHTLITVILGPLVFGRLLCGWGCWRSMVLELLPIGRSPGRRLGAWRFLPLLGLALSVGSAAFLYFSLGHHPGGAPGRIHGTSVLPLAVLCALYSLVSIGLALLLRDARAFCKYLCPSGAILRFTSRPSLARMAPHGGDCDDCGACTRACPMDIAVARYASAGRRVASGDCILCQRCAHACPRGTLRLTFRFDLAGRTSFVPGPPRPALRKQRGAGEPGISLEAICEDREERHPRLSLLVELRCLRRGSDLRNCVRLVHVVGPLKETVQCR